jgi:hypothetical protein
VISWFQVFAFHVRRVPLHPGEIRKGNQIIERLQAELRSAKAKAKLKAAVGLCTLESSAHNVRAHGLKSTTTSQH